LCRLRGHKPGKRDKINYSEFNREMIDEMNRRLSDGDAQRTALLKSYDGFLALPFYGCSFRNLLTFLRRHSSAGRAADL